MVVVIVLLVVAPLTTPESLIGSPPLVVGLTEGSGVELGRMLACANVVGDGEASWNATGEGDLNIPVMSLLVDLKVA